jgi:hypothetical protein
MYDKPIANIILHGEKAETISPKVRDVTRMLTLPTPIQHSPGIPSQSIKKYIKGIQIGKEIVKGIGVGGVGR